MNTQNLRINIITDADVQSAKRASSIINEQFKDIKFDFNGETLVKTLKEAFLPLEKIAASFQKVKLIVNGVDEATSLVIKRQTRLKEAIDTTSKKYQAITQQLREQVKLTTASTAAENKLAARYDKATLKVSEYIRKVTEAQLQLEKLEKQGAGAAEIAKATEHLEKMTATLRISVADAATLEDKLKNIGTATSKTSTKMLSEL